MANTTPSTFDTGNVSVINEFYNASVLDVNASIVFDTVVLSEFHGMEGFCAIG